MSADKTEAARTEIDEGALSRRAFFKKASQKSAGPAALILFSASVVPAEAGSHYGRPSVRQRVRRRRQRRRNRR